MDKEGSTLKVKLTPEQINVLEAIIEGNNEKQIAELLGYSKRAIERIRTSIYEDFAAVDKQVSYKEMGTVARIARIVALYKGMRITQKERYDKNAQLYRKDVRSKLNIMEKNIKNDTQITVVCLHDIVGETFHGIIISDKSPEANASPEHLEVWSYSPNVKVTHELKTDTKEPYFRVLFDPPLIKDQELTYHYRTVSRNYFPMSLRDLDARIQAKQYDLDERACDKSYSISTPTEHLFLQLTFPEKFQTQGEHVIVQNGRGATGPHDEFEIARICNSTPPSFSKEYFGRQTTLTLDLNNPLINRRYRMRWLPCI